MKHQTEPASRLTFYEVTPPPVSGPRIQPLERDTSTSRLPFIQGAGGWQRNAHTLQYAQPLRSHSLD